MNLETHKNPISIMKLLKLMTVEPVMLFYVTSSMMASLTTENLNLEKACLVNIGFNKSICQAMVVRNRSAYTADQEIRVQKLVASMLVYKTAIQGIIPFLLMLFLGSWSDRTKRRKPFIFMPIYGDITSTLGYIICTYFFLELPLEVAIFFEAVPVALTGTWFCFFVGIYSYVTENSSEKTRTMRVGIATMFTHVSLTSGIALSGVVYKLLGFYGVYSLSILMFSIALLYGFLVLEDNDSLIPEERPKKFLRDVFDYRHVAGTLSICLKKRENNRRLKLMLIMALVLLNVGSYRGELTVMYMFTRRKFTWSEIDYSGYNTYHSIVHMTGALFCLCVFIKWMKIDDTTLGMLAMISKVVGCFASAFAAKPLYFYLAALTEIFNGSSHIAMRSIMSKLVTSDELGQTFALFGLCEALTPLLCGPLYSYVYQKTIEKFPGAFYFVSACLHTGAFLIFLWLYFLRTKNVVRNEAMKDNGNVEILDKTEGDLLKSDC
ncbi:proton-coupled folate transporter-like [Harmonia axyridis]|uniref:proton-coupled folate transporter-like n=1 Tax=Harmonia axyridis TaxID=115357 RepID=UPI001E276545|nr:proton-coupled folate transporter-like [Harmonia axyridis]